MTAGSHSPALVLSEENIRPSSNHHRHEEGLDDTTSSNTVPIAATASTKKVRLLEGDTVMKRSAMGEYVNYPPLSSNALPTPSPLDYAPKTSFSGYHYTLSGRNSKPFWASDEGNAAGPAQFNTGQVHAKLFHGPSFSIGHGHNYSISEQTNSPGPLAYDVQYMNLGNCRGKSCKLTGKAKAPSTTFSSPGPNIYLPKKYQFHQSPKYSFGTKSSHSLNVTPGPSDYDTTKSAVIKYSCAPAASLKTTGHGDAMQSDAPGEKAPAPNVYYPKAPEAKKVASLKGRYVDSKSSIKTPGPANYILTNASYQSPKYTMTARNFPFQDDEGPRFVVPGPADYNVNLENVCSSRPKYSLGRKPITYDKEFQSPGPGKYDPKFKVIESSIPKVSMRGRHGHKSVATPGPSDYAVNLSPFSKLKDAKGKKIFAQKLKEMKKSLSSAQGDKKGPNAIGVVPVPNKTPLPGPSDYDIRNAKSLGPAYSLGVRLQQLSMVETPGPNVYDPRGNTNKALNRKISLRSRHSPFVLIFPTTRFDTLKN